MDYNSNNHRGYNVLTLSLKEFMHVSRHVVFDEGFFPAKDTQTAPLSSSLQKTLHLMTCLQ
jgi:hypothetical protein